MAAISRVQGIGPAKLLGLLPLPHLGVGPRQVELPHLRERAVWPVHELVKPLECGLIVRLLQVPYAHLQQCGFVWVVSEKNKVDGASPRPSPPNDVEKIRLVGVRIDPGTQTIQPRRSAAAGSLVGQTTYLNNYKSGQAKQIYLFQKASTGWPCQPLERSVTVDVIFIHNVPPVVEVERHEDHIRLESVAMLEERLIALV